MPFIPFIRGLFAFLASCGDSRFYFAHPSCGVAYWPEKRRKRNTSPSEMYRFTIRRR